MKREINFVSYLSAEKRNGDIDGVVLESRDGDVIGLEVERLSSDVEADGLGLFGLGDSGLQLGKRLGSGEVENIVLLTANGDIHDEAENEKNCENLFFL